MIELSVRCSWHKVHGNVPLQWVFILQKNPWPCMFPLSHITFSVMGSTSIKKIKNPWKWARSNIKKPKFPDLWQKIFCRKWDSCWKDFLWKNDPIGWHIPIHLSSIHLSISMLGDTHIWKSFIYEYPPA